MEGAGHAIHVTVEALALRADTATVALLLFPKGVDVAVVVVELLLGDRDTLTGRADVDVGLIVIACHKKFLRFSIARNGGIEGSRKMGAKDQPQS